MASPGENKSDEEMDSGSEELSADEHYEDLLREDFDDFGIESAEDSVESELRKYDPLMVPLFRPNFHSMGFSVRETMLRFNRVYHARYPQSTLDFFLGDLGEAVTEAFQAKEMGKKQLLVIYLHDDNLQRSTAAHSFPRQVLSNEVVLELLGENYLTWAWDITSSENYDLLRDQMAAAGLSEV